MQIIDPKIEVENVEDKIYAEALGVVTAVLRVTEENPEEPPTDHPPSTNVQASPARDPDTGELIDDLFKNKP